MDAIDIINAKMNKKDVDTPRFLYKYRPFDKHTFDMLENSYVFLCPAECLDDPTECAVNFSTQDLYDMANDRLKFKCIDQIMSYVRPYTDETSFQQVNDLVWHTLSPSGYIRRNFLLDMAYEMQMLVPEIDISQIINLLGNLPEMMDKDKIKKEVQHLFSLAYDARSDLGICSLSELKNSDEMWRDYANNSQGYCVEYDMREYENLSLLYPVVYQDDRETNIITNILGYFVGEMIYSISRGQLVADRSSVLRLFLTKNLEWAHQEEWRLIGDARMKLPAPTINVIYLGKNMSEQNKQEIMRYCKAHSIRCE